MGERNVLVYRETLLAGSEPFIAAQGEALERHRAWYLGLRRVAGHPLPADRDLRWSSLGAADAARRYAWKTWAVSPRTVHAVRRLRPVLIHAHFGRDAVQVLPLAQKVGVPLVTTFHGHDALRTDESFAGGSRSDRLYLARRGDLARLGARFLAVSSLVRDRLVRLGFPGSQVELHHIGVDVDGIARVGPQRRDDALVLFVGRLVPHKGLGDLIEALAKVRTRTPRARLVVVGDGPERAASEARARELRVPADFVGFRPQEDAWRWMARAAVVVVPSRTASSGWMEAFGLVAAEAQAARTPVIASTCGGLPEAVAPCCEQLLFDEGDVNGLAQGLDLVLSDPDRMAGLGDRAQRWVREHRSLVTQNRRLESIYEEVAPA